MADKRGRGRPPKAPEDKLGKPRSVRLTHGQEQALGPLLDSRDFGAWLRGAIDARLMTDPPPGLRGP